DMRRNQYQLLQFAPDPESRNIAGLVSAPPFLKGETAVRQFLEVNPSAKLIDVREEWEFVQDNMGGEHIPLGELPEQQERILAARAAALIFICQSGKRSKAALQLFKGCEPQLIAASLA